MKRLFIIFACAACMLVARAQDQLMAEDKDRVALTAVIADDEIPAGAHKQLVNKMNQIAAKNGCAATSNSRFIITCSADVLTKDITPTAPPMHAYTLSLNFFVGDGVEGRLFSSCAIEAKGVGQTPDKAYINALKNIRVSDPQFKAMLDKGKEEIIAYYNSQCALVIKDAQAKASRGEYTQALATLTAIPPVCEDCYQQALDISVDVYQAWRDHICQMALQNAQTVWATRDVKAAAEALNQVPVDGACVEEAKQLREQIAGQLNEEERRDWDFMMKQYEDEVAARESEMELASKRLDGNARRPEFVEEYGTNSGKVASASGKAPATNSGAKANREQKEQVRQKAIRQLKKEKPEPEKAPTYQVKGKWFK